MPQRPKTYRPPTAPKAATVNGQPRPSAARRGYGHKWREARAAYLAEHPFCAECKKHDLLVLATEVDHIVPHKGNPILFWTIENWQSLCGTHHKQKSVKEAGGRVGKGPKGSRTLF